MALINTTTTGVLGTTVYGDGAGALTVQQDGVQIAKVAKNPTFYVYLGTGMTPTRLTWTKVSLNTKVFDTENCFDTTNYRFLPTVAGYYQINLVSRMNSSGAAEGSYISSLFKNGSEYLRLQELPYLNFTYGSALGGSTIVYMNGTTDYVESYVWLDDDTTRTVAAGTNYTTMSGTLVKAV